MSTLTRSQPGQTAEASQNRPEVGDFRRMGPFGPVYEVIAIESPESITIRELESERVTHDYPAAFFHSDLPE